jgi:hypothetical protein
MAEESSWPTQNSGPTGTLDSREVALHTGGLVMPGVAALKAKQGFRPCGGASPGLVTATGTPDGFVHVAPFQLLLQNGRGSGLGVYITALDAIKDINILSTPADPTNARRDLVIAQQSDIFDSDANSDFVVKQVVGTPSGSPVDPTVTGSSNYVTLARVTVPANATSINSGNITDLRTSGHAKSLTGGLYTVALGGLLPVASKAERDALTSLYEGLAVYRQDKDRIEIYDGAAWRMYGGRPTSNSVATAESTASAAYTDLTTAGPAVTVETGTEAKVTITAGIYNSGANVSYMGFGITGATTLAASDARTLQNAATTGIRVSVVVHQTGLTAGDNTFTAKYRAGAGTASFFDRVISVEAV